MHARGGMIELEGVTREFRTPPSSEGGAKSVRALDGVTLSVRPGQVTAVVGPNGAGKSTLFALVLGFLRPTSGKVALDGMAPRAYMRRRGAAYLPERFQLPGGWSVRAALLALARLEGLGRGAAEGRVQSVLDRLGLVEHGGKPVGALSRGLLQRLGLAQALLAARPLVVLDEPTEGLDPLWRIRLRGLVESLRSEGRTVLIASHDLGEVERLADRAVVLERGRVREVVELARGGAAGVWRLELTAATPALADAFPGARAAADGRPVYWIEAADPAELSGRVAALLAGGGVLVSLQPAAEPLEERVRRALEEAGE